MPPTCPQATPKAACPRRSRVMVFATELVRRRSQRCLPSSAFSPSHVHPEPRVHVTSPQSHAFTECLGLIADTLHGSGALQSG